MYVPYIYKMDPLRFIDFDWDDGNETKNWVKHHVAKAEAEEVFFNTPLLVSEDTQHSQRESRFAALGITNGQRQLTVVFTLRGNKIRVISARDMSKKERATYEAHS